MPCQGVEMASMQLADKLLVHQVHRVKVGTDGAASARSNNLLWKAPPKAALIVRVVPPMAGSVAVLGLTRS